MGNAFKAVLAGGSGNKVIVTCAPQFAGATITCTNNTKTYTKTCPSTSPYTVEFKGLDVGTWTISGTVQGQVFTTTVEVQDVSAVLSYGFVWTTWVDTASQLDSTDYNTLDELLEDEKAVRELMLEHACVDYLSSFSNVTPNLEKVIENDICAKWINLCDYALDTCYSNAVLKAVMDEADKYGFGEWALVGQVPTMTSATAPYGTVIESGEHASNYAGWKAFDGDDSSNWIAPSTSTNNYIGYTFTNPIKASKAKVVIAYSGTSPTPSRTYKIQGSNDGFSSDVNDLGTLTVDAHSASIETYYVDLTNISSYNALRLFCADTLHVQGSWACSIVTLQFYAWAPKGNVPVMTANNAPYGTTNASSAYSGQPAYYAFDGNDSTAWVPAAGAGTNAILYWNSVVPVRATKIKYRSDNARPTSIEIQGWNSEGDYHTLALISPSGTGEQYFDLSGDIDYYTHYCLIIRATSEDLPHVNTLQFYGRELSVSVPKMDTNTTPYGEAIYSTQFSSSAGQAFIAFDKQSNASWMTTGGSTTNQFIGYIFNEPVCAKMVMLYPTYGSDNSLCVKNWKIQARNSTSDEWVTFKEGMFQNTNVGEQYIPLDNDTEYKQYRAFIVDTYNPSYVMVVELQFYGLDYSEKEFEAGTTKKWLYDHGVELETIDVDGLPSGWQNNVAIKESSQIYLPALSTYTDSGVITHNTIDLTNYSLARMISGNKMTFDSNNTYGMLIAENSEKTAQEGYQRVTPTNPVDISLDLTSFNQNLYIAICSCSMPRSYSFKELWLE